MNTDALANLFQNIPSDWILLGLLALLFAFVVVRSGSARVASYAFALPIAVLLNIFLSHALILGDLSKQLSAPMMQALLFIGLVVLSYIFISRIGVSYTSDSGQPIQAAIAGVAATALTAVVWIQVPALGALWHFGASATALFGSEYAFWWVLGSLAALSFVRR